MELEIYIEPPEVIVPDKIYGPGQFKDRMFIDAEDRIREAMGAEREYLKNMMFGFHYSPRQYGKFDPGFLPYWKGRTGDSSRCS